MTKAESNRLRKLPLIVCPAIGVSIGAIIIAALPLRHPDDRMFFLFVYSAGLGVFGLLCGYLYSLRVANRIRTHDVVAVAGILLSVAGYFIFGKAGHWTVANAFAVVGWVSFGILLLGLATNRPKPDNSDPANMACTLSPGNRAGDAFERGTRDSSRSGRDKCGRPQQGC